MKITQKGDVKTVKFEWVKHAELVPAERAKQYLLIIVFFDGEPDMYYCDKDDKDRAIDELKQYYGSDWHGTGRILPIHIYELVSAHEIDCGGG